MSRIIRVSCPQSNCGIVNIFDERELIGEVPLVNKNGVRIPPPQVKIDKNTFVKCEKCGYPISCKDALITE